MNIDSDSARFSRTLQSAILWPVGIIFLTALLLLPLIFELFQVVRLSDRSYRVLAETRVYENLILSTSNNVRGYLLTGDADFVKSYDTNRDQAAGEFKRLRALVADNPEQVIRADDLDQATKTWFAHAETIINHRSQNIPVNQDWIKMGKTILDGISARFDKFADVEEARRDTWLFRVQKMKLALAYAGGGLVILLSLTVAHLVRKRMMELDASYRKALDTIEQRHAALARSEADLEEQKEWLRVTLTSIGDGVIVTDPQGRIVLMNHESERLTGWTIVEALHQPLSAVFKIVDEKTLHPEGDLVARILTEKKVIGIANPTVLLSRNGEKWPIEDSAAPISNAKGTILGVVVVFHCPRMGPNPVSAEEPII
ncbi:MAG: CHASE3 domain-containing protein [Methylacidiphilales bacterium]|nr:CHASE3 domain-containing protein [Candidatus Methylacidiphilales bacterium]